MKKVTFQYTKKMQLPDEITTAWMGIATSSQPFVVETTDDSVLFITNLCLSIKEDSPKTGRVLLNIQYNDQPELCLVPFTIGAFESTQINLLIPPNDKVKFTVKGANADVHMIGFLDTAFVAKTEGGGNPLINPPTDSEKNN